MWIVLPRRQNDEREVRPGRLVLDPIEQGGGIGAKKRLLGDDRRPAAALQLPLQFANGRTGCAAQAGLLQQGAGDLAVPAGRRKHEHPVAVGAIDWSGAQSPGLSVGSSGVAPPW